MDPSFIPDAFLKKQVLHPPTRSTAVAQPQMSRRTFFQGEECNDPRRVASKANGHGARDQVTVSKQPELGCPDRGLEPTHRQGLTQPAGLRHPAEELRQAP